MPSRTDLVENVMSRFPQVPHEAVIKEDLLRGGLAFDDSALTDNEHGGVKPKSYFILHGQTAEWAIVMTNSLSVCAASGWLPRSGQSSAGATTDVLAVLGGDTARPRP